MGRRWKALSFGSSCFSEYLTKKSKFRSSRCWASAVALMLCFSSLKTHCRHSAMVESRLEARVAAPSPCSGVDTVVFDAWLQSTKGKREYLFGAAVHVHHSHTFKLVLRQLCEMGPFCSTPFNTFLVSFKENWRHVLECCVGILFTRYSVCVVEMLEFFLSRKGLECVNFSPRHLTGVFAKSAWRWKLRRALPQRGPGDQRQAYHTNFPRLRGSFHSQFWPTKLGIPVDFHFWKPQRRFYFALGNLIGIWSLILFHQKGEWDVATWEENKPRRCSLIADQNTLNTEWGAERFVIEMKFAIVWFLLSQVSAACFVSPCFAVRILCVKRIDMVLLRTEGVFTQKWEIAAQEKLVFCGKCRSGYKRTTRIEARLICTAAPVVALSNLASRQKHLQVERIRGELGSRLRIRCCARTMAVGRVRSTRHALRVTVTANDCYRLVWRRRNHISIWMIHINMYELPRNESWIWSKRAWM